MRLYVSDQRPKQSTIHQQADPLDGVYMAGINKLSQLVERLTPSRGLPVRAAAECLLGDEAAARRLLGALSQRCLAIALDDGACRRAVARAGFPVSARAIERNIIQPLEVMGPEAKQSHEHGKRACALARRIARLLQALDEVTHERSQALKDKARREKYFGW